MCRRWKSRLDDPMTRNGFGWLALGLLIMVLTLPAAAQTDQFLPEIDTYYKATSPARIWFQAKETNEAGAPVTAVIRPSLVFYIKSPIRFASVTTFDLDDSKARALVFSVGYRYLPTPNEPPTNRDECGSAPAFRRAAGGHSTSVLGAKDEAAFDQVWHYDDALCTVQHFFRDTLVGSRHYRLENIHGFLHAIDRVFTRRACPREASNQADQTHQQQRHYLFHVLSFEICGTDLRN